ncbi:Uncharacterised protein [Bifidobacterium longum subsp. infantis]|uniref:Uncharacterized protein n=1 Tax=Bifidobacterium longum subsp. infantis TaxID=1682 RepID=A0A564VZE8_BIFLI|nr:Uncharacterised protein [Bifidobacterium longum subsp. infantis]
MPLGGLGLHRVNRTVKSDCPVALGQRFDGLLSNVRVGAIGKGDSVMTFLDDLQFVAVIVDDDFAVLMIGLQIGLDGVVVILLQLASVEHHITVSGLAIGQLRVLVRVDAHSRGKCGCVDGGNLMILNLDGHRVLQQGVQCGLCLVGDIVRHHRIGGLQADVDGLRLI